MPDSLVTPNDTSTNDASIAIIYHSNYGHTRRVAHAIAEGGQVTKQVSVRCCDIAKLEDLDWEFIDAADMLVFGSAVYMGSVTAEYKTFMDTTSQRWFNRVWQGKWAAGFANSGGLSGDKLAVLQQLCLFAMQHGMNWAGLPIMPTGHGEQDINRLSSFLGLMTQSGDAPPEQTPCAGDIETAKKFGEHLAAMILAK